MAEHLLAVGVARRRVDEIDAERQGALNSSSRLLVVAARTMTGHEQTAQSYFADLKASPS